MELAATAPLDMPIPDYGSLPEGPPEIPGNRSLDALKPEYKPRVIGLRNDLNTLLAPVGVRAIVSETERTSLRQIFLWGIGRFYQAPGRTGIVTKVRDSNAKHKDGLAVDFAYMKAGIYAAEKLWLPILLEHSKSLETKHQIKWGGNFKGTFKDWPHWESV
jgi:hypothetical protein